MTRTPTRFALLSLALLGLSACGNADTAKLDLGYSNGASRDAKGEVATDAPLVDTPASTYEWNGGEKPTVGDAVKSWTFTVPKNPTGALETVTEALFGKRTRVHRKIGEVSTYYAGSTASASFTSSGDERTRWWYFNDGQQQVDAEPPCAAGDTCSKESTTPEPTMNLPTDAEASARAEAIVDAIRPDVEGSSVDLSVSRNPYNVLVVAQWSYLGNATGMSWNFSFGERAALMNAGGPLFGIKQSGEYAMISVDDAIARLNKGFGWTYPVSAGMMAKDTAVKTPGTTSSEGPVATVETFPPAPAVVHVTKATTSLVQWWVGSSGQMLLPAWTFSLDNGGEIQVVAVPDKFVTFQQPEPRPVDSSPSSGSGSGSSGSSGSAVTNGGATEPAPAPDEAIPLAEAEKLVGLTEAEAQKVAEGNGWTWRITMRDGKSFQVTMDYSPTRVDVEITKGVVTAAKVG